MWDGQDHDFARKIEQDPGHSRMARLEPRSAIRRILRGLWFEEKPDFNSEIKA
jgi:hypothetical protein